MLADRAALLKRFAMIACESNRLDPYFGLIPRASISEFLDSGGRSARAVREVSSPS